MNDCLFCKIVDHQIPSKIVYEDDRVVAIEDVNPQAPLHILLMPKAHIATLNDLSSSHDSLIGEMIRRAASIARLRGVSDRGYRMVFNCNREAGQSVFHIHLHLLGGRTMTWPPG